MSLTDSPLVAAAWSQLWQVTALALAVGALVRFEAKQRPHLAHALWMVVILKCLTPPLWSSPTGIFSWAPFHWAILPAVATSPPRAADHRMPIQLQASRTEAPFPLAPRGTPL